MYRADHGYERHRNWPLGQPLDRKPSECFGDNVCATFPNSAALT